ncbi:MAG: ShlB/FhaC/HecB family hemolysin secretion/activation protein, partial [Bacteroidota bacterium]
KWVGFILLTACATNKTYYNPENTSWESYVHKEEAIYETVFLLGDAGKPSRQPLEPAFKYLKQQMDEAGAKSHIIYLGDNLYPRGLSDSTSITRKEEELHLLTQVELLENYEGKGFFIPGNHDWAQGRPYGFQRILNQGKFIESLSDKYPVSFLPAKGCPGPESYNIGDDIVLIFIDTQWWLHRHDKPGIESGCEAKTDDEFLIQLDDIVKRNYDKKIIVAAHHPLISNGLHGGHSMPQNHLFPVLGSIYVFYRTILGNIQDIPHPRYKMMKKAFQEIFSQHPNLMYVSGHDHSLQYLPTDNTHFIISGSGCKTDYVVRREKAAFAVAEKGFGRIDFYKSGEVWLSFFMPEGDGSTGKLLYRKKLITQDESKAFANKEETVNNIITGSTKGAAVDGLHANGFKKFLLGENYRKEWRQQIEDVPIFDIGKEHGGLTIVKRGGGMQTKSLRLEAKDGRQYVLRSIEKFPEKAVPVALRGTVAADIVEDQISGSHPYGALVVPKLAEQAGVYHTNPQLVYLPDDPRLGIYRQDFGDGLYLYEERPDDKKWKDASHFGNPKDIIGTDDVLEKTREDNDDLIDQQHVLKSRLFDMWIGDWDRHEDQWRWAEYKNKKEDYKYYRPIPRDRDQAFFNAGGIVMTVGTRKWGMRKFQGFKDHLRDPAGLGFNARFFDRTFLTEPDLADWMDATKKMKASMTDEIIEKAIKGYPKEIYQLQGDEIIRKLKARRDNLEEYARTFYLSLAKEVNVLGSDKHEYFKIERLNDAETRVRVWKRKKDDSELKHLMYDRTFKTSETKEVRLYGFDGEDVFDIEGDVNKGIKVRIIGGDDDDVVNDKSKVAGPIKKNLFYDNKTGDNSLITSGETKDKRSDNTEVNLYDRREFKYDLLAPAAFFGFNPDDGVFIGGGARFVTHGFRKSPYKTSHLLRANVAPRTRSYNLAYNGEFIGLFAKTDLLVNMEITVPSAVNFFYGNGNETVNQRETAGNQFHRVRYDRFFIESILRKRWQQDKHDLQLGFSFQNIELEDEDRATEDRFIYQYINSLPDDEQIDVLENAKTFTTLFTQYVFDNRDSKIIPTRGIHFLANVANVSGAEEQDRDQVSYWNFRSNFSLYLSTGQSNSRFNTTWATRVGGAINRGDYEEIFQSNFLGGFSNLRGYRRMRFAGERSFYWNNDVRIKLFNFRTYLLPGQFGIHGIYDIGRVWVDGQNSDKLHKGYGGGIWVTPFGAAVISLDITRSEEEDFLPFVRFGF